MTLRVAIFLDFHGCWRKHELNAPTPNAQVLTSQDPSTTQVSKLTKSLHTYTRPSKDTIHPSPLIPQRSNPCFPTVQRRRIPTYIFGDPLHFGVDTAFSMFFYHSSLKRIARGDSKLYTFPSSSSYRDDLIVDSFIMVQPNWLAPFRI